MTDVVEDRTGELERLMLEMPQAECQTNHYFGPGIYIREAVMPAGAVVLGHRHRSEHMCALHHGKIALIVGADKQVIEAPAIWTSDAGRKVFLVIEDAVLQNIYATSETDIDKLEEQLVEKTDFFLTHQEQDVVGQITKGE